MPTPPPFQAVPGTIRARITAHYDPAPATAVNLLYFAAPSDEPSTADCEDVLDLVDAWVETYYRNEVNSDWRFIKLEAQGMEAEIAAYASRTIDTNGELSSLTAMPSWSPLILLGTGYTGRSNHGRVYTLAPDIAAVNAGRSAYTSTHMDDLVADFQALLDLASAASTPLVVASPTHGSFRPVTGITFSPRFTMQKRRRPAFGI